MYYDEDNLLDLRLNILNKYVDKFIIVESKFTHSGNLKNKNFDIENFKDFKNKIDYYFIENEPLNLKKIDKNDTLEVKNNERIFNGLLRDNFQRENLNQGIKKLNDEDFIMISDLDEIPNLDRVDLSRIGVIWGSGVGGIELGFKQAGFDIAWANEMRCPAILSIPSIPASSLSGMRIKSDFISFSRVCHATACSSI